MAAATSAPVTGPSKARVLPSVSVIVSWFSVVTAMLNPGNPGPVRSGGNSRRIAGPVKERGRRRNPDVRSSSGGLGRCAAAGLGAGTQHLAVDAPGAGAHEILGELAAHPRDGLDRKSTRLNSRH